MNNYLPLNQNPLYAMSADAKHGTKTSSLMNLFLSRKCLAHKSIRGQTRNTNTSIDCENNVTGRVGNLYL